MNASPWDVAMAGAASRGRRDPPLKLKRQPSNLSSSTSSDILVAPGPSHSPPASNALPAAMPARGSSRRQSLAKVKEEEAKPTTSSAAPSVRRERAASVLTWGRRLYIQFNTPQHRDVLRNILSRPPRPGARQFTPIASPPSSPSSSSSSSSPSPSSLMAAAAAAAAAAASSPYSAASSPSLPALGVSNDASIDGPNHRGTYSKEYTLKHPEIAWVHRGQGRYLPGTKPNSSAVAESPRSNRHAAERSIAASASINRNRVVPHALDQSEDPAMRTRLSRKAKTAVAASNGGRRTSRRIDGSRRRFSNRYVDDNDDQDDDDDEDDDNDDDDVDDEVDDADDDDDADIDDEGDDDEDEDEDEDDNDDDDDAEVSDDPRPAYRTSRKSTANTNIRRNFQRTGRGGRRGASRGKKVPEQAHSRPGRPATTFATGPPPPEGVDGGEMWRYRGAYFYEARPQVFVPGFGPPNSNVLQLRTNSWGWVDVIPALAHDDPLRGTIRQDVSEVQEDARADSPSEEPSFTVNKAYTLSHPEVEWVHRGNGRYRPAAESPSKTTDRAGASFASLASTDRRSSRTEDLVSRDPEIASPNDDMPRSRGRLKRAVRQPQEVEDDDEASAALFDKSYVEAHPNEVFHHRGQGRYARGPRLKPNPSSQDADEHDADGLVDSAYVHQHPNETFHHRGQGKWARGLPPPGSSNKVAVRGPGARDKAEATRVGEEEDEDGNRPPTLSQLVLKKDGPDRWPRLQWFYRGGGKWARTTKLQEEQMRFPAASSRKPRASMGTRGQRDGAEAQLHRETLAAGGRLSRIDSSRRVRGGGRGRLARQRSDLIVRHTPDPMRSKASSDSHSKANTPRPALLPPEQDRVTEEDLPSLYKEDWSSDSGSEMNDIAGQLLRQLFRPLNDHDSFVKALQKHDPAVRSLDSLKLLAGNAQSALEQLQDEYLEIDKIVSQFPMAGKKERKAVRGGRIPIDPAIFEDRKEAILYDYTFDARKIGYQDPEAQRVVRDAEGRELRRRRNRDAGAALEHWGAPDPNSEEMTSKRAIKPVSRFDGVVIAPPPRKKTRLTSTNTSAPVLAVVTGSNLATDPSGITTRQTSATPDPSVVLAAAVEEYKAPTRGRWKDHVPKRIRELRGESVASNRSSDSSTTTTGAANNNAPASPAAAGAGGPASANPVTIAPAPSAATSPGSAEQASEVPVPPPRKPARISVSPHGPRKGRPPGSKNLHKRRDAGIKKGPRKPKPPIMDLSRSVLASNSVASNPANGVGDASTGGTQNTPGLAGPSAASGRVDEWMSNAVDPLDTGDIRTVKMSASARKSGTHPSWFFVQ